MPLINIEYTSNINSNDFAKLSLKIHQILSSTCNAEIASCKSTITRLDNYVIGDGLKKENGFLTIKIGLAPGRTSEQKKSAASAIEEEIKKNFEGLLDTSHIKVQIRLQFYDLNDYFFLS